MSPVKPGAVKSSTDKVRDGFISKRKRKYADKCIQTLNIDIEIVTGDEPPLAYWKDLAETRRKALEDALHENEQLHSRIDDLEKENEILEEMMQDAKQLAKIISSITGDDDNEADESGIVEDETSENARDECP